MVALTANYDLPYAEGTDAACDGGLITQSLAEAVDAILDGFDFDGERLELVPYARMSLATAYTTDLVANANSDLLIYDTVDVDTAGIADTVKDNRSIWVGTTGIWLGGAYLYHGNTGVGGAAGNTTTLYTVINRAAENDRNDEYTGQDRGTGYEPQRTVSGLFNAADYTSLQSAQLGSYLDVTGTVTAGALTTIGVPSRMYAWWVSDSP